VFTQAGRKHRVPPKLLVAQAMAESGFRVNAVSSAGAQGIMQLMPEYYPRTNPFNPTEAIPAAAESMARYFAEFGKWRLALAAYNWGPTHLLASIRAKETSKVWPGETKYYVTHVMVLWARVRKMSL